MRIPRILFVAFFLLLAPVSWANILEIPTVEPTKENITSAAEGALSNYFYSLSEKCHARIISGVLEITEADAERQKSLRTEMQRCLDPYSRVFTKKQFEDLKAALSDKESSSEALIYKTFGDTALIKIRIFEKGVVYRQFEQLFSKLENDGIKHVILDLRDNPGGYTVQGLRLAYHFSTNRKNRIMTRVYRNAPTRRWTVHTERGQFMQPGGALKPPPGTMEKYDTVVLVNGKTVSIAETVAGVLKDWGIKVVGKKTYGKGIALRITQLPNGVFLILSHSETFVGNNRKKLEGVGVTPHITINDTRASESDTATKRDLQFQKALELLRGK